MEVDNTRYLIVFESYNGAMLLYNKLLQARCKIELISTPCRLSRGCSQSIVFSGDDAKKVIEKIKESKVVIRDVYKMVEKNNRLEYIHI
jgi:hypothetical protein